MLRLLAPKDSPADQRLPVIYLLPVEARDESRYGNPLEEIQRSGVADRQAVIFAAPTFWQLPWYADHPTDRTLAQERYLVEDIVPFVERNYPAQAESAGRLLLGFSKSGWGAWSLLLRHPNLFGRAAAWDAPFQLSKPGPYGSGPIFGTPENFARYDVKRLLARPEQSLGPDKRLILLGYDAFRSDHVALHAQLEQLRIAHEYRDGPRRAHHWHSGWVAEAVELLLAPQATAP
jgi:S-formylglutathione hydrolase FrmB